MPGKDFGAGDLAIRDFLCNHSCVGPRWFQRLTRNGILRDTPNLMMRMCLPSLPQHPTHFQQSPFLRWFRCWVLVLSGLGSTFGFAVGRAKLPQAQQPAGKTEERAQEDKPRDASQASDETSCCAKGIGEGVTGIPRAG